MKKVNTILIIFISLIGVMMVATWRFVESEKFSSVVTQEIRDLLKENKKINVSFRKLSFNVLPPGVELHDVNVAVNEVETASANLSAKTFILVFDHFNPFSFRPKFKDIILENADLKIYLPEDKSNKNKNVWDLLEPLKEEKLNKMMELLPLKLERVLIQNTNVAINGIKFFVEKLRANLDAKKKVSFKLKDLLLNQQTKISGLSGNISIGKDKIFIGQLKVFDKVTHFVSGINIDLNNKSIRAKSSGTVDAFEIKNPYVSEGKISIKSSLNLLNEKISADFFIQGKKVKSDFFDVDELEVRASLEKGWLHFKQASVSKNGGRAVLVDEFKMGVEAKTVFPVKLSVKGYDLDFNTALYFLRESLAPLKGKLSGIIGLKINSLEDVEVSTIGQVNVKNLGLEFQENKPVMTFKDLNFKYIDLKYKNDNVNLNFSATRQGREILGTGNISKKLVEFKTNDFKFDFDDIHQKLSSVEVEGEGVVGISVEGDLNESIIHVDLSLNKSKFLGFNLGDLKTKIDMNTLTGLVDINSLKGRFNKSDLFLDGYFNSSTLELGINAEVRNSEFKDFVKIHESIAADIDALKRPIWGIYNAKYSIGGSADLELLTAEGELTSEQGGVETESFKSLSVPFTFGKNVFSVKNGSMKKNKTTINFDFSYDLKTKISLLASKIKNGVLGEINAFSNYSSGLISRFDFFLEMKMQNGEYKQIENEIKLYDSEVESEKVADSNFRYILKNGKSEMKANIFENEIAAKMYGHSYNHFFENGTLQIRSKNLRRILSTIYGKGKYSTAKSSLSLNLDWNFDITKNKFVNLEIHTPEYNFFDVVKKQRDPCLLIENYKIEYNKCSLVAPGFVLTSKGSGHLLKDYFTDLYVKIEPSILTGVMPELLDSSGNINLLSRWSNNFEGERFVKIWGNDVYLNTSIVPVPFKSVNFEAEYYKEQLNVKKFSIDFNQGKLNAKGSVDIGEKITPYIEAELKDVLVDFNDKTSSVVSAKVSINGGSYPYLVEGQAFLKRTFVYNEVEDFKGSNVKKLAVDPTYLPKINKKSFSDYFKWRVAVQLINPIVVSNSTYELVLGGDLRLVGSMSDPRVDGELVLAPGSGKTYFKNNEFIFSEAKFVFTENFDKYDPIIDAKAYTTISGYKINIHAQGRLSDLTMGMSSEPSLSESSILSLIAFGYTDNLSAGLSQADRSALSSVGVGAIFFEKLKVNSFLKESTGFQLNLGTDFAPDQKSMLSGANNRSEDLSGRFRSATKIELRRKLMDNLMLSVASTVGGSIGQKQSMNLNYNLNRIISLEGVYEVRTMEEGEENIVDTSIGGDLKWRWSFK